MQKYKKEKSSENPKKPVFSMDSEDSQTNFHENRRMKMDAVKIVNKINKEHGTIKNVYFLACGGSLVDLYPGYYFVRAESAVMDAQWIPAREFALTPPKKLGKDSLLIICSHSGKTKECLEGSKNRNGCRCGCCYNDTCARFSM